MPEPEDFVVCRICGKKLRNLNSFHLISKYCKKNQIERRINVNSAFEYRNIFPGVPTMCTEKSRKCGWGRGLTKETDPRVLNISAGLIGHTPWNKDLTKETDERVRRKAEGQIGRELSKKHRENISKALTGGCWFKDLPKTDSRVKRMRKTQGETMRCRWAAYTEEERKERIYKLRIKSRPNKAEAVVGKIVGSLGFKYNKKETCSGYSRILGRMRSIVVDFVHNRCPVVLQYDGWGGHGPNNPRLPKNVAELDNERDKICLDNNLHTIRILPSDLSKGREYVVSKVKRECTEVGFRL